jgi:hypothetical protein
MTTRHVLPRDIRRFVALQLDEEENEGVLGHITSCDTCLSLVDAQWEEDSQGGGSARPEGQASVERRLFENIHRTDLAGQIVRLSTRGTLSVFVALLGPFLGTG